MIWNFLTFLNKDLKFLRKLEEPSHGNSVKISDYRAFSLFETVLGCRALSHSVNCNPFEQLPYLKL